MLDFGTVEKWPAKLCRRKWNDLELGKSVSDSDIKNPWKSYKEVPSNCAVSMDWDVIGYLHHQYGGFNTRLGSVITLTGSEIAAYAVTCGEYVKKQWPRHGPFVLSVLQQAIDQERIEPEKFSFAGNIDGLMLRVSMPTGTCQVNCCAYGDEDRLSEAFEIVSWMGAALRTSPILGRIASCKARIVTATEAPMYKSGPVVAKEVLYDVSPLQTSKRENACWLSLFHDPCIAGTEFPIPERQSEIGLEIRLHLAAVLIGAQHAVEFDGGIVLKGYSSMLVPISRENDIVQWHLVLSETDGERISYQEGIRKCERRVLLETLNLEDLNSTRAIVGWCSHVKSTLGTESGHYSRIDYSQAEDAGSHVRFSGATLGFQQFGVGQLDFAIGKKDRRCHVRRDGHFRKIISCAERTPVVLYNQAEQRAWLASVFDVLMHVVQKRRFNEEFDRYSEGEMILKDLMSIVSNRRAHEKHEPFNSGKPPHPEIHDGPHLRNILLQNANKRLLSTEDYTIKDAVCNIWSILEILVDQNVQKASEPGVPIRATPRDILQGFEFEAIVEERSPMHCKRQNVRSSSGGWTSLIKDIDALVLFGAGFGDLLQPDNEIEGLCRRWLTVPRGKDYLAAPIGMLENLYAAAGCRTSKEYLTSTHLQWHRGQSLLFEPCASPNSWNCRCNRLQQILKKSTFNKVVNPGALEPKGAVIFGEQGLLHDVKLQLQPDTSLASDDDVFMTGPVASSTNPDSTASSNLSESSELTASSCQTMCSEVTAGLCWDAVQTPRKRHHDSVEDFAAETFKRPKLEEGASKCRQFLKEVKEYPNKFRALTESRSREALSRQEETPPAIQLSVPDFWRMDVDEHRRA